MDPLVCSSFSVPQASSDTVGQTQDRRRVQMKASNPHAAAMLNTVAHFCSRLKSLSFFNDKKQLKEKPVCSEKPNFSGVEDLVAYLKMFFYLKRLDIGSLSIGRQGCSTPFLDVGFNHMGHNRGVFLRWFYDVFAGKGLAHLIQELDFVNLSFSDQQNLINFASPFKSLNQPIRFCVSGLSRAGGQINQQPITGLQKKDIYTALSTNGLRVKSLKNSFFDISFKSVEEAANFISQFKGVEDFSPGESCITIGTQDLADPKLRKQLYQMLSGDILSTLHYVYLGVMDFLDRDELIALLLRFKNLQYEHGFRLTGTGKIEDNGWSSWTIEDRIYITEKLIAAGFCFSFLQVFGCTRDLFDHNGLGNSVVFNSLEQLSSVILKYFEYISWNEIRCVCINKKSGEVGAVTSDEQLELLNLLIKSPREGNRLRVMDLGNISLDWASKDVMLNTFDALFKRFDAILITKIDIPSIAGGGISSDALKAMFEIVRDRGHFNNIDSIQSKIGINRTHCLSCLDLRGMHFDSVDDCVKFIAPFERLDYLRLTGAVIKGHGIGAGDDSSLVKAQIRQGLSQLGTFSLKEIFLYGMVFQTKEAFMQFLSGFVFFKSLVIGDSEDCCIKINGQYILESAAQRLNQEIGSRYGKVSLFIRAKSLINE